MATHSSSLPWEISRTEEPGGLQFTGSQKSQTRLSDSTTTKSHSRASLTYRKGNKNPKRRKKEENKEGTENLLFTHEFGLSLWLHFKAVRRKLFFQWKKGRKEREGEKRKGNKRKEKEKEREKKETGNLLPDCCHTLWAARQQSKNCPIRTELLCSSTKQADVFMDTWDKNRH